MMKIYFGRIFTIFACVFALTLSTAHAGPKSGCVTIKDGLYDSSGAPLEIGYDSYGYNYQASIFNGYYGNYTRPAYPVSGGDKLQMKWNDAWLSNMDCDGDGKLDRHYGYSSYIGSGAWLTNHMWGSYVSGDKVYNWDYFVKIAAAPADASVVGGKWIGDDGIEIGPVIWGQFAVIQEIYNDQGTGEHGVSYKSPAGPGLGRY